ncbi:glycosyl hydrolase family 28-related protein [Paenibacillus nasutitermitis]|uniref:Rhamnogalacturonase A/B/Epimerase-like pectate lyase domain-containing protein n=1 Tax=Paenibacillus nasutitermitis TaxID=1652958 RepID=A0A916ZD52_9BACL|nr:glycosyl hydrolase family 28-related protein [Paenibacillus nasutitermitis]GGD88918.1 hypothetical protein GCM10010911_54370 [Paenibacillus nasutitermitis]
MMRLLKSSKKSVSVWLAFVLLVGIAVIAPGGVQAAGTSDINVKAAPYSAVGDGVADDTTAIQNAINAAQSAGGGVVFFPKGTYKISSTLRVTAHNVQLEGTGKGSVVFLNKSTDAVIHIGDTTDMHNTTHNKVKNLTIDRSVAPNSNVTTSPSYGIRIDRARFTTLEGVTVYNAAYGISVGVKNDSGLNTQFVTIQNSLVMTTGSMRTTSVLPGANIVFWSGADYKLTSTFLEPTNVGIMMDGNSNGINIDKTTVINGAAYNYGIVSGGTGFARYIVNCIVENAHHQQIYIAGGSSRVTVADSWIGAGDEEGTSTRKGILIEEGTNKITIADNRIGDQQLQAIYSKGDNVTITGNILERNVVYNRTNPANCTTCDSLQIEGGKHVIVSNNRVFSDYDRNGIGLFDDGARTLNYYIITSNDTSESGSGIQDSATGTNKVVANNL